ncbi:MAG: hypothetical protein OEW16_07950 [Gammaproteobacteria bacterium]|nr:hypothetical protein [Gammaproteobacteria bacterium]
MTASRFIMIGKRFRGPPQSGNGGYVCGLLAGAAGSALTVRLLRPPPLDQPLEIREDPETSQILLMSGEGPVASGRQGSCDLEVPEPPPYAEALAVAHGYEGFREHAYPGCFVCGPERARGDGMRIFASAIAGRDLYAAAWLPDESLAGADGKVLPEFMWAALDCPGFFAIGLAARGPLLGEFTARVDRRVHVNEACVVIGWSTGHDGRKHYSGTAVFDENGEPCARAAATWIELKR